MDKKLAAKIKKYKLLTYTYKSCTLPDYSSSAKLWADTINDFLTSNNLEDATIEFDTGYDHNYLEINISAKVMYTEAELQDLVDQYEKREADKKEEEKKRQLEKEKKEKQEYERLKKKYG